MSSQTEFMTKLRELDERYALLAKKLILANNRFDIQEQLRLIDEERKALYEAHMTAPVGYKDQTLGKRTYPKYVSNKMI